MAHSLVFSLCWFVSLFSQLTGRLPNFANLPSLQTFQADSNSFSGLPVPFPFLPMLQVLTLSNNQLAGTLDTALWTKLPSVGTVDLSSNSLTGVIPSPSQMVTMDLFSLSNNQLNSPMVMSVIATVLDLR